MPSVLAVAGLIAKSNLAGCMIGTSLSTHCRGRDFSLSILPVQDRSGRSPCCTSPPSPPPYYGPTVRLNFPGVCLAANDSRGPRPLSAALVIAAPFIPMNGAAACAPAGGVAVNDPDRRGCAAASLGTDMSATAKPANRTRNRLCIVASLKRAIHGLVGGYGVDVQWLQRAPNPVHVWVGSFASV
jgi:hypothetical protein